MDFGGYTALRGFFGSADKKAQRAEDLQYAQLLLQQQQLDQQKENQYRQQQQQLIDQADQLATQVIRGKGVRQKDKEAVQNYASSLMTPINDMITKYGSYDRAMANGLDRLVANYKFELSNNELIQRIATNKDNFKNLLLAKNDPSSRDRIFQSDLDNLKEYELGNSDYITYKGMMGELNDDFINDYDKSRTIQLDDYYVNNQSSVDADYARDTGLNPDAVPLQYKLDWLNNRMQFDKRPAVYGSQEISTSLGKEMTNGLSQGPVLTDPTASYKELFESSSSGADIFFNNTFGYDATQNAPTKNGYTLNASGRIMTDNPTFEATILAEIHKNQENGRLDRRKNGQFIVRDKKSKGMFNYKGDQIKDDDIGFFSVESETFGDKLVYQGMFVGQKIVGINKDTGEKETMLLTKTDSKDKMAKINRAYSNLQITPAYIAAYEEGDLLFDDIYYEEVELTETMLMELNKDTDASTRLTQIKNQLADTQKQNNLRTQQNKGKQQAAIAIENLYAGGTQGGADQLYNAFAKDLNVGLVSIGIKEKMLPLVLAELMETVDPKDPNAASTLKQAISNIGSISSNPAAGEYYNILKTGNANTYFKWLTENKPKQAKQIKQRAKAWSNYIKNN